MAFPGFALPSDEFIANYLSHCPSVTELLAKNVTCEHAQEAFRWMRELPTVTLPPAFPSNLVRELSRMLISGGEGMLVVNEVALVPNVTTGIVVDHSDWEAVASALVLQKMVCRQVTRRNLFVRIQLNLSHAGA